MFIDQRFKNLLHRRIEQAGVQLVVELWNRTKVRVGSNPDVTLRLRRPRAALALLRPDLGRLAAAYIDDDIDIEGPIHSAIEIAAALSARAKPRKKRRTRHSPRLDARAASSHYDVSNDFYGLWLDPDLVYSCAYFDSGLEDLREAQQRKLDHVCKKLLLQRDERFLDVGCGWGALLIHAAKHYGVKATGIANSRAQVELARERICRAGLSARCEVMLRDYRGLPGEPRFDKIASVGMVEHVGADELPGYVEALERCLEHGGLLLNHGIASTNADGVPVGRGGGEFIDRHVFPRFDLPHVGVVSQHLSRRNLETMDVENLRPHYAQTLLHWLTRLEASEREARALVGERRYRTWRVYLAGGAYAFERGWIAVYQTLAAKPLASGRVLLPWTRAHVYDDAAHREHARVRAPFEQARDWQRHLQAV